MSYRTRPVSTLAPPNVASAGENARDVLEQLEVTRLLLSNEIGVGPPENPWVATRVGAQQELVRIVEDFTLVLREQNRSARDLARRDAWWRRILDHIPGFVIVMNVDGDVLFSNLSPGAESARSRTEDELPRVLEHLRRALPSVIATGQIAQMEIEHTDVATGERCYFARLGLMPGEDGDLAAIAVVTDASQAKRLEHERALARRITSFGELALFRVSSDLVIVEWSDDASNLFGWTFDEVVDKKQLADLIAPHSYDLLRTRLKEEENANSQTASATPHRFELAGKCRDGSELSLLLALIPVDFDANRGFGVLVQNISIRRNVERELHDLRRRNQLVLDSVAEGICGFDSNGILTFVNPAAAELLGHSVEALLGLPFKALFEDADASALIHEALERNRSVRDCQIRLLRKDRQVVNVAASSSPLRESGRVVGVVVAFRDQTQWQLLQAQLMQAQKLEAIGQLAAGIAHEINTPIQYVGDNTTFARNSLLELEELFDQFLEFVSEVKKGTAKPERAEQIEELVEEFDLPYMRKELPRALEHALEGVGRVSAIVGAMKAFSHPGTKERTDTDLNQALENTATVTRNEWKYVADMELDLLPDLPLVSALEAELNQVFVNLIVNAAHAINDRVGDSGEKGKITISTGVENDSAVIRFRDTGSGILEENLSRVFDPFFTTKPVGKGTGQGLAIARSIIVDKHGGSINVDSKKDEGTQFTIRLPLDRRMT